MPHEWKKKKKKNDLETDSGKLNNKYMYLADYARYEYLLCGNEKTTHVE